MEISVRACDEDEALEILCDPSVVKLLSITPASIHSGWIKLIMDHALLVLAKPDGDEIEVHVACRYRDRAIIRKTMQEGLQWFINQGYRTVWTTAPDERKALGKMLESLHFRKVGARWEYGN